VAYIKALALCEYPTKNGGKMELIVTGNPCYGRNELTNSVILVVVVLVIIIIIIIIIQRNLPITTEQCDSRL
jgi:hypothetical protein